MTNRGNENRSSKTVHRNKLFQTLIMHYGKTRVRNVVLTNNKIKLNKQYLPVNRSMLNY